MPPDIPRLYRILALDGGGIRGILSARILERIEQRLPGVLEEADLLAGTSTGGILALALALGMSPRQIVEFYQGDGPEIFARPRSVSSLWRPKYSADGLRRSLRRAFGDARLRDLRRHVLIPTVDLAHPAHRRVTAPKFFTNLTHHDLDESLVDVALRTAAAPTFFPTAGRYIDGGVAANSPGLCALSQALHPSAGSQRLENVRLLAIGTGREPPVPPVIEEADSPEATPDQNRGLLQWAPQLVGLLLGASAATVDYQARQILQANYHRLDIDLPTPVALDDTAAIPQLLALARDADIARTVWWLRGEWAYGYRGPIAA